MPDDIYNDVEFAADVLRGMKRVSSGNQLFSSKRAKMATAVARVTPSPSDFGDAGRVSSESMVSGISAEMPQRYEEFLSLMKRGYKDEKPLSLVVFCLVNGTNNERSYTEWKEKKTGLKSSKSGAPTRNFMLFEGPLPSYLAEPSGKSDHLLEQMKDPRNSFMVTDANNLDRIKRAVGKFSTVIESFTINSTLYPEVFEEIAKDAEDADVGHAFQQGPVF